MSKAAEEQIQTTIQIYFDSMFESSAEKVHQAFHANARITGYLPQGFFEMTVGDFASFVQQQPAAHAAGKTPFLEVVSLNVHGQTAVARVRDDYLGHRYLDTLSFVQTDGRWLIYNKLFHIEGEAAD
ncbi:MAG: nuclear transport factor 2 family protein [Gammaproteobacteria bacterium]|jgi:hypothetical protein|nr:nuclear transport factor 2 family protein [Gammaproteobacteria bacterium]